MGPKYDFSSEAVPSIGMDTVSIYIVSTFYSLIFIRVSWENIKIYTFHFLQIYRKRLQEIAKLQYINLRAFKASIIKFLSFDVYFLFVAIFFSELQGKI